MFVVLAVHGIIIFVPQLISIIIYHFFNVSNSFRKRFLVRELSSSLQLLFAFFIFCLPFFLNTPLYERVYGSLDFSVKFPGTFRRQLSLTTCFVAVKTVSRLTRRFVSLDIRQHIFLLCRTISIHFISCGHRKYIFHRVTSELRFSGGTRGWEGSEEDWQGWGRKGVQHPRGVMGKQVEGTLSPHPPRFRLWGGPLPPIWRFSRDI